MSTLQYIMAFIAMIVSTVKKTTVVQAATSRAATRKTATRSGVKNTSVRGTKTREGNVRALAHRTAVNMARRNKAAKVALKYGHRAIQAQRVHAYAMRDLMSSGKKMNCGIKAKKRALMGTGFLAKDVKKQSYRAIAVGCRGTFTVAPKRAVYVRSLPTKDQIRAGKAAARLQSFHAWVIAQDGGWISKSGKVRLAALQQKAAA